MELQNVETVKMCSIRLVLYAHRNTHDLLALGLLLLLLVINKVCRHFEQILVAS